MSDITPDHPAGNCKRWRRPLRALFV